MPQLQTTFVKCLSDPQKEVGGHPGGRKGGAPYPTRAALLPPQHMPQACTQLLDKGPCLHSGNGDRVQGSPHPRPSPLPAACPFLPPLPAQVRQRAATNLGELTRLSMRADQLVSGEGSLPARGRAGEAAGLGGGVSMPPRGSFAVPGTPPAEAECVHADRATAGAAGLALPPLRHQPAHEQ